MKTVTEFRGTDDLYIAKIAEDSDENYTVGTPRKLAPTADISRTIESNSESHYYSNSPMIVIASKGKEQVVVTTPVIDLADSAEMLGQYVDAETGAVIEGDQKEVYYALMYRIQKTDDTWRYVVKSKARLVGPPEEVSVTKDDGTTTNNQQLTFECIKTIHAFENKPADGDGRTAGIVIDENDDKCTFTNFFTKVRTPDNISELKKTV